MKVLTSAQMRDIDRRTIEEVGIPGSVLMENAALRLVSVLRAVLPEPGGQPVVVVAGRGNNGGDGLAAARHLHNSGCAVHVLLLAGIEDLKGEALLNARICRNMTVPMTEVTDEASWAKARSRLRGARVVVDALFGTGLAKPAEGLFAQAIRDINSSPGFKLSVDIPSGLSSDTFNLIGPAVRADMTVTLAAPKVGHVFPPSEEHVGELVIADIGIPRTFLEDEHLLLEMVDEQVAAGYFRKRPRDSHKGTYGHLLIIAGSRGKTGAAVLAGRAALRSGAGLVTLAVPESCLPIVARSTAEYMTEPLAQTAEGTIDEKAAERALKLLRGKQAVLLGPGLSVHPSTARFVHAFLSGAELPVVIDADGLNILADNMELLSRPRKPAVLTPHPGEFGRLSGLAAGDVLARRLEIVPEFAKKHGIILTLKGHRTLTAAPDGRMFINGSGNPGLATGGSGDVLSGLVGGQLVQEKNALGAVLSAVYAHGLAGDLAADKLGQKALNASDIIRFLPSALKTLEDKASAE